MISAQMMKYTIPVTIKNLPETADQEGTDSLRSSRQSGRTHEAPHPLPADSKCYVYDPEKPTECQCCHSKDLTVNVIQNKLKTGRVTYYRTLYCAHCDIYHVDYKIYSAHRDNWILLNPDEFQKIDRAYRLHQKRKTFAKKLAKQKRKSETHKTLKTGQEEKLPKEAKKPEPEREKPVKIQPKEELQYQEKNASYLRAKERWEHRNVKEQEAPKTEVVQIWVKDFVVRRTTFKCRHNEHKLQNIEGLIRIMDRRGDIKEISVPAGYCPNCKIFFVMESTYQRLKQQGTLLCRISDEKSYLYGDVSKNGMRLAQESVLMQYGYTVSQEEGLSPLRRRKILSLLIDNGVLTKSDIISYLDFFVSQRKNQPRMERAIAKWERDREFISGYKAGNYTQYTVRGIARKSK